LNLSNIIILLVCLVVFTGCKSNNGFVRNEPIPLQPQPKRVAVHKNEDKSKYPNTHWIEKDRGPIKIKPDEKGEGLYWRAPKEGAIAWPYDSWEAFLKSYQNYLDWADNTETLIKNYNDAVEGKTKEAEKPWYRP